MTKAKRYPRYTEAKSAVKERMRAICLARGTLNLRERMRKQETRRDVSHAAEDRTDKHTMSTRGKQEHDKRKGARRARELRQRESNVVKDAVERIWQRQKPPWPVGLDQAQSDAVL